MKNAACRRRVEDFEIICFKRMLRTSLVERRTNAYDIQQQFNLPIFLPIMQQQIIKFLGYILRKDRKIYRLGKSREKNNER